MYGAILGDIVGSPYEFDRGDKTKDFPLFSDHSIHTDDTVMTLAIAEALLKHKNDNDENIKKAVIKSMQFYGNTYPFAGYGGQFAMWLRYTDPKPYNSYGNGSAMRVSSVGWLYDTIERTREVARLTAEVSHNHPEGIKGAESVASVIFWARQGKDKEFIKQYIMDEFGYDLNRTLDEIRPNYHMNETCQGSVPESIISFLESTSTEDAIRNAVSLGGDADTTGCIAGSMAEAMYGVPEELKQEVRNRLPEDLLSILIKFDNRDNEEFTVEEEKPIKKPLLFKLFKKKGN